MKKRIALAVWLITGGAILAAALATASSWSARDTAAAMLDDAYARLEVAERDQTRASLANITALELLLESERNPSEDTIRQAARAAAEEQHAYRRAEQSWEEAHRRVDAAVGAGAKINDREVGALRLLRSRALIGSGRITTAVADLENLLEFLPEDSAEQPLRRLATEELSKAYFFGARLMRLTGKAEEEWMLVAERAREHARSLVEDNSPLISDDERRRHQRNLETIITANSLSLDELRRQANPSDCPSGQCRNLQLDGWPWQKPGRNRSMQPPGDGRGGGAGTNIVGGGS